jgi:DNA-binding Xre family transcriptional regulator
MSESGFIYAIGVEGLRPVKIGKTSRSVAKRLAILQTGHPAPLKILAAVPVEQDLSRIEKAIHRFLEADRQRGEWFAVEVDQSQLEALIVRAVQELAEDAAPLPRDGTALGDRLRMARLERRLSQASLGKAIGLDQSYISKLERGELDDITLSKLESLADALGLGVEALLARKRKKKRVA